MPDETPRWWATAAAGAGVAAALAIPIGILSGTAAFCMAAGPFAVITGCGALMESPIRGRWRGLIPGLFAVGIGSIETMFLVIAIIRWSQTGVFPTM